LLRRNVPHVGDCARATRFADQRRRLVAAVESINYVAVSRNAEPKDRSGPRRGVSRRATAKTQTLCGPLPPARLGRATLTARGPVRPV